MSRRITLIIDKYVHINDTTFEVFRSTNPSVSENDQHIMDIFEPQAMKEAYQEVAERLIRDPDTPYAFLTYRHFEAVPTPNVMIGSATVAPGNLALYPDEKRIEIFNQDIGTGDTRNVYMSYQYVGMPVKDDYGNQLGVTYYGPPATGLRPPLSVEFIHDEVNHRIRIRYVANLDPVVYYYRIRAKDQDGNKSKFSQEHALSLVPDTNELYFRIERSMDNQTWELVKRTNLLEWYDLIYPLDYPQNVYNLSVLPISSTAARIEFENPWNKWREYSRRLCYYRIRAEDFYGEASEWLIVTDPPSVHIKPKEILIRRKVDNGAPSTENEADAIDVFRLREADVDVTQERIVLIDDKLSEKEIYGYTFFYTDELDMKAEPVYVTSDHREWDNIILYRGKEKVYGVFDGDFTTSFTLA